MDQETVLRLRPGLVGALPTLISYESWGYASVSRSIQALVRPIWLCFNSSVYNTCAEEYSIYLYGTRKNITIDPRAGSEPIMIFVVPLINCVLRDLTEYIKYSLGTSQVMLGLTPTIIALLSASSEEVCLLAWIRKRRFLALLLAAGSPSIYTSRAFEYRSPREILKDLLSREHVNSTLHTRRRWVIVIIEYVCAFLALANIIEVSWELGRNTINGINPNTTLMPMLWFILAILAHLAGSVIFQLQAKRSDYPPSQLPPTEDTSKPHQVLVHLRRARRTSTHIIKNPQTSSRQSFNKLKDLVRREFWIHPDQGTDEKVYIQWYKEGMLFVCLAWFLSVLIIFHIILGTLILSSTEFIGPRDALGVMARYVLSVVTCRVILVYELAVVRVCYSNGLVASAQDKVEERAARMSSFQNAGNGPLVHTAATNETFVERLE